MGTSYIEFNGYGFWTRDSLITTWLLLLVREVDLLPSKPDWVGDMRDYWLTMGVSGAVGCVDTGLVKYLSDENEAVYEDRVKWVVNLSVDLLQKLSAYNQVIPLAELISLQQGVQSLDVYITHFNVGYIIEVGNHFTNLLSGYLDKEKLQFPIEESPPLQMPLSL